MMPPSPIPSPPSPTLEPSHWNLLVIALVGGICTIILLFTYYKVLQRCSFQGIAFSRNPRQRQLLNENNLDDPSLQFQSRGLDSYVMHSLPISQFKKKNEEDLSQTNTDCPVCLGEFEEGEWLKHLPICSHAFHVSCIDMWFLNHSNCPLCRSHVYDLSMHQEYSVSMDTLLETLRREDFFQERSAQHQVLRSHILQSSSLGLNPENTN